MKSWSVSNKVQIDGREVLTAEGRARRIRQISLPVSVKLTRMA